MKSKLLQNGLVWIYKYLIHVGVQIKIYFQIFMVYYKANATSLIEHVCKGMG